VIPLEAVAACLGLINILLVVRRSVWNYPFGLAMVALYGWIFAQPEVRLYSDAGLQAFFFAVQLYGWWNWSRAQAEAGEVAVLELGASARGLIALAVIAATVVWGQLMARFTDAALPVADAFVAMASVAAQLLMARRYWENWVVWIAVDLAAITIYAVKGLTLTAFLYLVFLGMSAVGLVRWKQAHGAARQALPA
jgi:nicotinamide mononucleotide transporter